jgi:hypothetical protein
MQNEVWKDVVGYEGYYIISNYGNLINKCSKKLKPFITHGYLYYHLSKKGKYSHARAHRLVAIAFIPNPDNLPYINHKDCNKQNNFVENLEWCTAQHNSKHAFDNGRNRGIFINGHININRKLTLEQVVEIKKLLKEGLSQYKVAKLFNVSRGTISAIVYGFTWREEGTSRPIKSKGFITPTEEQKSNAKFKKNGFKFNEKWNIDDIYKTRHNQLMKVVGIRKDGVALIEMIEPYKSRAHTQKHIPIDWIKQS